MSKYLMETLNNVEHWLDTFNLQIPKKIASPLSNSYRPELDISEELKDAPAKFYESMIGCL